MFDEIYTSLDASRDQAVHYLAWIQMLSWIPDSVWEATNER